MEVNATLPPGANGTKALLRMYGDQPVCVRYRYDRNNHKRYKTVEIIGDEKDGFPGAVSASWVGCCARGERLRWHAGLWLC